MKYVLDACSLIAFFEREEGSERVWELLSNRTHRMRMHSINMCEVYYHFAGHAGEKYANRILREILLLGVEIFDELDPSLWKVAGLLKVRYKRLSLADAIGVAYARRTRSTFITSDHSELDPLANDKVCNFSFSGKRLALGTIAAKCRFKISSCFSKRLLAFLLLFALAAMPCALRSQWIAKQPYFASVFWKSQ